MKYRNSILIIGLVLSSFQVRSQLLPDSYFEGKYGKLEYGFYVPEDYNANVSYPLIMYLHGFGNNYSVYLNWYNEAIQNENPCFVFAPRTPTSWGDWSGWWENLSEPMLASLHVLDSLTEAYNVDTNRLYVYGISMGGEGVFDLLDKLPHKFAAAMSVCGGGRDWWADDIANTPFWMFHGSDDDINPPNLTEDVYNELVKIGAKKMRYTNYPGYGHSIWDRAESEPSWNDWMFAFSKTDTVYHKPNKQIHLEGTLNEQIELHWNDVRNPAEKANKIWYYKIYNKNGVMSTVEFNKTSYSFTPVNSPDTFRVKAVNYHFQESEFSNAIIYSNNNLVSGIDKVKKNSVLFIYNNEDSIIIRDKNSTIFSDLCVELYTLDGKLLFKKEFSDMSTINIDIGSYHEPVIVASVRHNNKRETRKLIK